MELQDGKAEMMRDIKEDTKETSKQKRRERERGKMNCELYERGVIREGFIGEIALKSTY